MRVCRPSRSTLWCAALALVLTLAAFGGKGGAASLFNDSRIAVSFYDVDGNTLGEIERSMRERGPADAQGIRRYAYTHWHITWRWPQRDGRNDYTATEVDYKITVLLPRLSDEGNKPEKLRAAWQKFYAALVAHEQMHADHARENYLTVAERVLAAYEQNSNLSESEAEAIAQRALSAIRRLDRELDRQSVYGKTQGVELAG